MSVLEHERHQKILVAVRDAIDLNATDGTLQLRYIVSDAMSCFDWGIHMDKAKTWRGEKNYKEQYERSLDNLIKELKNFKELWLDRGETK